MLSVFVHKAFDPGEPDQRVDAEVGHVEHGVGGEDPIERWPVAVVDGIAVSAR